MFVILYVKFWVTVEINKPQMIIIDEIGYLPFSPSAAHLLFQLVNRRYEKKSVVITSNRPPSEWRLLPTKWWPRRSSIIFCTAALR